MEKLQLNQLYVHRLFGDSLKNYTINIPKSDPLVIIHGKNGSGKTSIFKLLNSFFNGRYHEMRKIPFCYLRFKFSDNSEIFCYYSKALLLEKCLSDLLENDNQQNEIPREWYEKILELEPFEDESVYFEYIVDGDTKNRNEGNIYSFNIYAGEFTDKTDEIRAFIDSLIESEISKDYTKKTPSINSILFPKPNKFLEGLTKQFNDLANIQFSCKDINNLPEFLGNIEAAIPIRYIHSERLYNFDEDGELVAFKKLRNYIEKNKGDGNNFQMVDVEEIESIINTTDPHFSIVNKINAKISLIDSRYNEEIKKTREKNKNTRLKREKELDSGPLPFDKETVFNKYDKLLQDLARIEKDLAKDDHKNLFYPVKDAFNYKSDLINEYSHLFVKYINLDYYDESIYYGIDVYGDTIFGGAVTKDVPENKLEDFYEELLAPYPDGDESILAELILAKNYEFYKPNGILGITDRGQLIELWVRYQEIDDELKIIEGYLVKIRTLQRVLNDYFDSGIVSIDPYTNEVFKKIENTNNRLSFPDEINKHSIENLSSGEQQLLLMFFDLIFETKFGSLVLIDEPELSLHISWQNKFIDILEEISDNFKYSVIVATHSPDIVNNHWDICIQLAKEDFQ